jgi:hypothetical protein
VRDRRCGVEVGVHQSQVISGWTLIRTTRPSGLIITTLDKGVIEVLGIDRPTESHPKEDQDLDDRVGKETINTPT